MNNSERRTDNPRPVEEQTRLIRAAVEQVSDSVMITTADLERPGPRIVYVTPAYTKMTGYTAAEVLGKSPRILQGPKTSRAVLADLRHTLNQGQSFRGEIINYRKDRSEYVVELLIDPVRDANGQITHWVTVQQDITERKRAEETLLQAERLAAIGSAMAGLSHESRNALQRSEACLAILADEVRDQPVAMDLIARIRRAQDELHQLYEDVREYAAPIRLNPQLCHLGEILQETWGTLEFKRAGRNVHLHEEASGVDQCCEVDEFAVRQIFRNILDNSLAACQDPVAIDVIFNEAELDGRAAVQISLRDNGPGLTDEQRRRIFDEFYTTKTHGTGLGMAIASRLVAAHRGRISVGSGLSRGAEIVVVFPRRQ
jgi:hypothetical protein